MIKKIFILFIIFCSSFFQNDKWDSDKSNWSELMKCCYLNDINKMDSLIESGVDLNYRTKKGTLDALIVAIKKGHLDATKVLVNTGFFDKRLQNYFNEVIRQENPKIVEYFISKGVDVNHYADNGHSYLLTACTDGDIKIVKALVHGGAEINHQRNVDGISALMIATFKGNIKKVQFLLEQGADKNLKDLDGNKAIDYIDLIYPRLNVSDKTKIELRKLICNW